MGLLFQLILVFWSKMTNCEDQLLTLPAGPRTYTQPGINLGLMHMNLFAINKLKMTFNKTFPDTFTPIWRSSCFCWRHPLTIHDTFYYLSFQLEKQNKHNDKLVWYKTEDVMGHGHVCSIKLIICFSIYSICFFNLFDLFF